MKKLEDLKKELLENKVNNFYVFYGEDYGIRRHYIDRLSTYFQTTTYVDSYKGVADRTMAKSLFTIKQLFIVYNDQEFLKLKSDALRKFIERLKDYYCVFIYEQAYENTTLWKEFSDYITYFPVVQDNIALEFVDSELSLLQGSKQQFIFDCQNNYNNILLESDKVKNYAQVSNMSEENAYESLVSQDQTLQEYEEFNSNLFMDDILNGAYQNLTYWIGVIKNKYIDKFYISLTSIFYDYLIAYLVKKYGKWDGSSRAYNYGLNWGRAKTIREFNIPFEPNYLLECSYKVTCIDNEVKSGKLLRENVIDYFVSRIL